MKKLDIPQAIYDTIIELLGNKTHQKQNGNITIEGKSKHPIYITFFNKEKINMIEVIAANILLSIV